MRYKTDKECILTVFCRLTYTISVPLLAIRKGYCGFEIIRNECER